MRRTGRDVEEESRLTVVLVFVLNFVRASRDLEWDVKAAET